MDLNHVTITGLQKQFPRSNAEALWVLDIPHLELRSDELTCVLGPTGCGKTTLLNILARVDLDCEGTIRCDSPSPPKTAYMFQRDLLLPWRTVLQNVLIGIEASGEKLDISLGRQWLESMHLSQHADSYPYELSVGMRQRVALARTLVLDAPLTILDEPLSAQDFSSRLSLEELLRTLLRSKDHIAVVVTHNVEEAVVLGDRIIVLGGEPARVVTDIPITDMPQDNRPVAGRRDAAFARHVKEVTEAVIRSEEVDD